MTSLVITGTGKLAQDLGQLAQRVAQPADLLRVLAVEGRNQLRRHFLIRDQEPNKLGGDRTHYWRGVADSITTQSAGKQLRIDITEPTFAQKVFGGRLVPKRAKYLTIPVNPKAHGRTAATVEAKYGIKLRFIRSGPAGTPTLSAVTHQLGRSVLEVFFVLRRSVVQAPDPRALPPEDDFGAALFARAQRYVARLTASPATPP